METYRIVQETRDGCTFFSAYDGEQLVSWSTDESDVRHALAFHITSGAHEGFRSKWPHVTRK